MNKLSNNSSVVRLARDLGLSSCRDCAPAIREYALGRVSRILEQLPVGGIEDLMRIVAGFLSVRIEFIHHDADVERLGREYAHAAALMREQLAREFIRGETEGYLVEKLRAGPGDYRFIAFVDAREWRAVRAYFTAWHEITHVLLFPPQYRFPGFRRVTAAEIKKDPLESLVDAVAGELAFYEPMFRPVLDANVAADGALTLRAIENARFAVTPDASFYAAALASIRLTTQGVSFVMVGAGLKKAEARRLRSDQIEITDAWRTLPLPQVRVLQVAANDGARAAGLGIFQNMRVPTGSVLAVAFQNETDECFVADEDQGWWVTSSGGPLNPLPLRVEAVRRGPYVYGLLRTL